MEMKEHTFQTGSTTLQTGSARIQTGSETNPSGTEQFSTGHHRIRHPHPISHKGAYAATRCRRRLWITRLRVKQVVAVGTVIGACVLVYSLAQASAQQERQTLHTRHVAMRGQYATMMAYSMVDTSRLSTYIISILLIVYGSFRSLNLEQENREKEKEKENSYSGSSGGQSQAENDAGMQTIDTCQAMFLPIGASISLLIMFLFFDSLQMVFAVCTAILATVAFAFLLLPMCQYVVKPCYHNNKISFGCCGRFTPAEILSFCISFLIVCVWVLTGHWLLMDALGMGLCVAFIALVRLPSLKVSTLLLVGLLVYDVFWVFFSSYIFSTNVMVKVATRPAENPVGAFAKRFHLTGLVRDAPKLSLPGKLVFPSMHNTGHFSMLGLGDIVMPGLLLCFVLRFDAYKKAQTLLAEAGLPLPISYYNRITYFHCSLIGYFLGLVTATVSSEVFRAAQPALLYLVPFTLLPLMVMAYLKGDLRRMWHEPFLAQPCPAKFQEV